MPLSIRSASWDTAGRQALRAARASATVHDMNPRLIQNDEVERRIIRNAEEEEKVVYTRNFHGRRGWWTNSNQLGFRVPYQPPVANRPITVLRLDEAGLPRVWTLSLGVEFDLGEGNAFEA